MVQARDGLELGVQAVVVRGHGRLAGRVVGERVRIEAGLEGRHQLGGDRGVGHERGRDIGLAERHPGLLQVAGDAAQVVDLPPGQLRGHDQLVHPAGLAASGPGGGEGVGEVLPVGGVPVRAVWQAQAEVVDGQALAAQVPGVGTLVDHLGAEHGQVRHHLGQGHLLAGEDLQPQVCGVVGVVHLGHHQSQVVGTGQPVGLDQVGDRDGRRVVGAIGVGELDSALFGGQGGGSLGELVGPAEGCLRHLGGDRLQVGIGGRVVGDPDDEEQPGQDGLADQRVVFELGPAEVLEQDLLDLEPGLGVVPVARDEHQGGDEPTEPAATQEDPCLPPLPDLGDRADHRCEFGDVGLEELVAGIGGDHLANGVPAVRVRLEAGGGQDPAGLAGEHRDGVQGLGVRVGGQQTEEAVLGLERAVVAIRPDGDVGQVARTVHRRAAAVAD